MIRKTYACVILNPIHTGLFWYSWDWGGGGAKCLQSVTLKLLKLLQ